MSVIIDNNKKLRLHRNVSSNLTKKQATNKLRDKLLQPSTLEGELISVMYMGSDNRETALIGYRTKSNYVIFDGISTVKEDGSIGASESNQVEIKREGDNFVIYQGGQPIQGGVIPYNTGSAIKDFFVRNGSYDNASKEVILTVGDGDPSHNQTVRIPVRDIMPTLTAGNGIEMSSGGVISAKVVSGSKLKATPDGLTVDLSEYVKTDNQAFGNASRVGEALKDALPNNVGANNKLVTQQDLQGFQPSGGSQTQVVNSNGATLGIVKGEESDSFDVVTKQGNIKVKLASGVTREDQLEDAIPGNMLRRAKNGGLYLQNLWDRGEY